MNKKINCIDEKFEKGNGVKLFVRKFVGKNFKLYTQIFFLRKNSYIKFFIERNFVRLNKKK